MSDHSHIDDEPAAEAAGSPPTRFELIFVLAMAAITAAIVWQAFSLPFFAFDGSVGPGFFPRPLSLALLAGLLLHAAALWRRIARQSAPERGSVADKSQFVAIALIAVAALLGSWAGLFAAVALILLAGLIAVDRLPLVESIVFTVASLVVFYLVFDLWLGQNIGLNGIL